MSAGCKFLCNVAWEACLGVDAKCCRGGITVFDETVKEVTDVLHLFIACACL